jgi:hypothetical protein
MSRLTRAVLGRWAVAVVAVAAVAVAVVALLTLPPPTEAEEDASAATAAGRAEPIAGSDVSRVILTEESVKRLDIQTAPVRGGTVAGRPVLLVPTSAVLYDPSGGAWAFTSPEPLVFLRVPVKVDSVRGDQATLSEGPPAGTVVVIRGVSELHGTEVGVGGDE